MSTAIVLCDDACCFGEADARKCCTSMWSTADELMQISQSESCGGNCINRSKVTQGILDKLYHGLISEETNRSGNTMNVHTIYAVSAKQGFPRAEINKFYVVVWRH